MTIRIGLFGLAAVVTLFPGAALPAPAEAEVTDAWTTAGGKGGGEAALYMTVTNHGGKPDALLRVRCPVAWAAEPRATDRGEGGLASRAVKSIAIPPDATVKLEPGGFHVALLQLNPSLTPQAPFSVMTLETSCIWLDPSPEPLM